MRRCDSAAMVPNTSDDLPDPETPVNTVSRRFGISMLTSFRLFSRAPWTRIRSWLSAACWLGEAMFAILSSSIDGLCQVSGSPAAPPGGIRQHEQVRAGEQEQGEGKQRRVGHPARRLPLLCYQRI